MINFKTLRWKNFLSTGNVFTEIFLDRNRRTLVVGKNGAGKSAMLDALSYVLYGKPFRKINKPQLLNSINSKDLMVEVEFEVGGNEYLVRRGMKPHVFEVYRNGTLINQDASLRDYQEQFERNILKMNHHAFCQVVILGSATYTPFMNLPAWQRREVVEDLLDIQIFSTMNTLLKQRLSNNREAQQNAKYEIDLVKELIEMQKRVQAAKSESKADRIAALEKKIEETMMEHGETATVIVGLEEQLASIENACDALAENPAKLTRLKGIIERLVDKVKTRQKDIEFYSHTDVCGVCHQHINDDFKAQQIEKLNQDIRDVEANVPKVKEAYHEAKEQNGELQRLQRQHQSLTNELSTLRANARYLKKRVEEYEAELDNLQNAEETSEATGDSAEAMNALIERLRVAEENQEKNAHDGVVLGYAAALLKDGGIKGQIIKQYIPVMNTLINKYLAAMDFFVQFELDEQFNEVIKSRYRDEFSYQSFSEGEKFRMNIAILFAWRALARMRNSASTNLLIMDEVFDSSLDAAGVDEFMKIISDLTKDTNLFVISHRGDMMVDKFDSVIQFEKHGNFSRIAS